MLLFLVPLALCILLSSRFSVTGSSSVEDVQIDGKDSAIVDKVQDSVSSELEGDSSKAFELAKKALELAKNKEENEKMKERSKKAYTAMVEGETFERSQFVSFRYNSFNAKMFNLPDSFPWDYKKYWEDFQKGKVYYDTSIGQFNGKTLLYDGKPLSQWSMLPVIDSHTGLPNCQNVPQGTVFGEIPLGLRLVYFSFPDWIIQSTADMTVLNFMSGIFGTFLKFVPFVGAMVAVWQGMAALHTYSQKAELERLSETVNLAFSGSNGFFALVHQNDLFYLGDANSVGSMPLYSLGRCFWFLREWVKNFPQDSALIERNTWQVYDGKDKKIPPVVLGHGIEDFANYTKPFGVENMGGHYIVTKFKNWKLGMV